MPIAKSLAHRDSDQKKRVRRFLELQRFWTNGLPRSPLPRAMRFVRRSALSILLASSSYCVGCADQAATQPEGTGGSVSASGSSGTSAVGGSTSSNAGSSGSSVVGGAGGAATAGSAGTGLAGVNASGGSGGSGGSAGAQSEPVRCGDATCELSETCTSCASDCGTCQALPAFGNTDIHPQKLDVYMSPDIAQGWLLWDRTERSLVKYHELLPDAWIRWDNETGHNTSTPENVEKFVELANRASVPMIITASAVQGYDNYWALNFGQPAGTAEKQVSITIKNIADGPYLAHAYGLLQKYPNVKLIETINEPDGVWFVGDYDNADSWDYYLKKLYAATGNDYAHILGPATAFKGSKIYEFHATRAELPNFSYHTYSGWQGLHEVGDKSVYVTEYGYAQSNHASELEAQSPALNLADLWQIEQHDKFDGKIERLSYVYLHTMMLGDQVVGDHHGFTGFFLALASYSALGKINKQAYLDEAHPDFIASDDGKGHVGVLLWNTSTTAMTGQTRSIPNVSASASAKLYVLRLSAWGAGSGGQCQPLADQNWVTLDRQGTTLNVTAAALPGLEAVYVSTQPCRGFVN